MTFWNSVIFEKSYTAVSRWNKGTTDGGTVRTVVVPLHDELAEETLREIADQCGANDFDAFCEWIDTHS